MAFPLREKFKGSQLVRKMKTCLMLFSKARGNEERSAALKGSQEENTMACILNSTLYIQSLRQKVCLASSKFP